MKKLIAVFAVLFFVHPPAPTGRSTAASHGPGISPRFEHRAGGYDSDPRYLQGNPVRRQGKANKSAAISCDEATTDSAGTARSHPARLRRVESRTTVLKVARTSRLTHFQHVVR